MELDYKKLGERIRAARVAQGMSQEQLAEAVDMTSQHISHTEVSSTKISLPALVKIANLLHTSVDKLLSDSLYDTKAHLLEEVELIFSDASPNEIYLMLQSASAIKQAMRIRNLSGN